MKIIPRSLAALELLLVFPAVLFLASLVVRSLQPQQYEPAHTAQRIVDWYATHTPIGLFAFMITMPLVALGIGSLILVKQWRRNQTMRTATHEAIAIVRTHAATLLIAATTVTATGILAIVALHVLAD
jgi:hypothetical protein